MKNIRKKIIEKNKGLNFICKTVGNFKRRHDEWKQRYHSTIEETGEKYILQN